MAYTTFCCVSLCGLWWRNAINCDNYLSDYRWNVFFYSLLLLLYIRLMAIKWSASSINIFNISKHFQSYHSYTYNINICIRRQRDFISINYHLTHDRCLNFSLNFMEHRFNQFYFIFTLLNRKNISIHKHLAHIHVYYSLWEPRGCL